MKWFLHLMEELGIDCQVGHPATIRAAEPRRQKHDQRDASTSKAAGRKTFSLDLAASKELLDLRGLLLHRHQWYGLRSGYRNALQAIALANGLRRGSSLWSESGQRTSRRYHWQHTPLSGAASCKAMYARFEAEIEQLNQRVLSKQATTQRRAADDSSWCGTDHGTGDRCLSGRSETIHRWQGCGKLYRDHSQGKLQRRATAAGRPEQAR